jgi:hypothetical protein
MAEIAAVVLIAGFAWFWIAGLSARDAAVEAARRACAAEGVQLLDETVASAGLRLRRDADGRLALLRVYRFEFSDTGDNRLEGALTLLGGAVQTLHLQPHRAPPPIGPAP